MWLTVDEMKKNIASVHEHRTNRVPWQMVEKVFNTINENTLHYVVAHWAVLVRCVCVCTNLFAFMLHRGDNVNYKIWCWRFVLVWIGSLCMQRAVAISPSTPPQHHNTTARAYNCLENEMKLIAVNGIVVWPTVWQKHTHTSTTMENIKRKQKRRSI